MSTGKARNPDDDARQAPRIEARDDAARLRYEARELADRLIARASRISALKQDGNAISFDDYELIKSRAMTLLGVALLDSPEAHLDYINRTIAGALSKHVRA
jgi:hypothetical protein